MQIHTHLTHRFFLVLVPVWPAGVLVAAVPVPVIWSIFSIRPAVPAVVFSSVGVPAADLLTVLTVHRCELCPTVRTFI